MVYLMNSSLEEEISTQRTGDQRLYYTFPIGWQLSIILPLVILLGIIGFIACLCHKRFHPLLRNRTALYTCRSRIASYSDGACVNDVNINIQFQSYQQKTVALTARQPVPDTSPLFDEPQSSEVTSNRCEVPAGHKKSFQAGKIPDNDKQNQKVLALSHSKSSETDSGGRGGRQHWCSSSSVTNRVHHLSVWVTSKDILAYSNGTQVGENTDMATSDHNMLHMAPID